MRPLRFLPFLAFVCLTGCAETTSLVGTWNGEMPENQSIKTPKGEFRANIVLELKADHSFHATTMTATLDGKWDSTTTELVLHPAKGTLNGKDLGEMKAKLGPMLEMIPPAQRAALEAYDPDKPWKLDIRNGGKNLFLPSRGEGLSPFTFRKSS